jgi:hypothetical protein
VGLVVDCAFDTCGTAGLATDSNAAFPIFRVRLDVPLPVRPVDDFVPVAGFCADRVRPVDFLSVDFLRVAFLAIAFLGAAALRVGVFRVVDLAVFLVFELRGVGFFLATGMTPDQSENRRNLLTIKDSRLQRTAEYRPACTECQAIAILSERHAIGSAPETSTLRLLAQIHFDQRITFDQLGKLEEYAAVCVAYDRLVDQVVDVHPSFPIRTRGDIEHRAHQWSVLRTQPELHATRDRQQRERALTLIVPVAIGVPRRRGVVRTDDHLDLW